MSEWSIVNVDGLGKLAEPAVRLIEKVSAGIGVLYEPRRIRQKAQADADARVIQAKGQIALDGLMTQGGIENQQLAQRALTRLVQEETKAQSNMEDVLLGATHQVSEDAQPEKMDEDWITHFFSKCRMVSDVEMQGLWSRVLAGEANHPRSFSKRTVEFIATISKPEAEEFTRLCRHLWGIHGNPIPLVFKLTAEINRNNGIHFTLLQNLDSLGLVHFGGLAGYEMDELPRMVRASYCGADYTLTLPGEPPKCKLGVGQVMLSPMGRELARVVEAPPLEGMTQYVLEYWREKGLTPASPWPKQ